MSQTCMFQVSISFACLSRFVLFSAYPDLDEDLAINCSCLYKGTWLHSRKSFQWKCLVGHRRKELFGKEKRKPSLKIETKTFTCKTTPGESPAKQTKR